MPTARFTEVDEHHVVGEVLAEARVGQRRGTLPLRSCRRVRCDPETIDAEIIA